MGGAEVGKVNPPKFEKCEDMVNLTYLNDASVFWNLKTRYQAKLIHTYSGLFVVVVNPYKRYPIYTHRVCKIYLGKRRNEAKLHYFLRTNLDPGCNEFHNNHNHRFLLTFGPLLSAPI